MQAQARGFLNISKPTGLTSHDVVARVRRLVGRGVKVGHAGTLDPAATGVLPIALGQATRLIEYLADTRKGYNGLVRLGTITTTDDAEGEPLAVHPVPELSDAAIEAAIAPLRGAIMQVPPIYSALHHEGRRLYELARAGKTIDLPARPVMVYRLAWRREASHSLRIEVECGKGTYIRCLARDIGAALGCGAHLGALERTFVGPFAREAATYLDHLSADPALLAAVLLPMETAVIDWPVVRLGAEEARRVTHGLPIAVTDIPSDRARAHGPDGRLIALLRRTGTDWRPDKVLQE